ncbi:MAG: ATP-binding protein, partial [Desulfovibrionaceae bacterium]|nr:ATP-binding protein [Desulfovibrionaceae bacterium]
ICWQVLQKGLTERCPFCPSLQLIQNPGSPFVWEHVNTCTNRLFKNTDSLVPWFDGSLVEVHCAMDITEQRRQEGELVAAKERAEASSKAKSEFLSRMSHEIRTPLTAIIGMTTIALASKESAKIQYCLGRVNEASQHLLGVINDILDMSKIEASKLEISPTEFELEKMLRRVASMVNHRVEEKQQIFTVDIAPGLPQRVEADEQRLAQILINLLANAVKFTPEGGSIGLAVSQTDQQPDSTTLRMEVTDTGIGISPEQQKTLFTAFEQADGSISRRFGGTGLGLAISRRIAELMGGDITLESEEGKGSRFILTVPVQKAIQPSDNAECALNNGAEGGAAPAGKDSFAGRRILLVEDVPINREIIITLLEDTAIQVDCATNGLEACRMFEDAPDAYDLIFMDIHMPEVDGYEATRRIRRMSAPRARSIPIIAMTADVFREDIARCHAAGMSGHIGKPIDPDAMLAALRRHCSRQEQ